MVIIDPTWSRWKQRSLQHYIRSFESVDLNKKKMFADFDDAFGVQIDHSKTEWKKESSNMEFKFKSSIHCLYDCQFIYLFLLIISQYCLDENANSLSTNKMRPELLVNQ